MRLFLSYPLTNDTPSYGDRDSFNESINSEILNGVGANTSKWVFTNNHLGTHVDTPFHFYNSGKKILDFTADELFFYNIHILYKPQSKGELIDLTNQEISTIPVYTDFLIIKTDYCNLRGTQKYIFDNPGLDKKLASKLKAFLPNLRVIGFDFISLTSWNYREHGRESHRAFLGSDNDFLIIEDMDLTLITENSKIKNLIMVPIRTNHGNGGPVTLISEVSKS